MEKRDLIVLCVHLGIQGMSERQFKCTMCDLIKQEMKNAAQYDIVQKHFRIKATKHYLI